MADTRTKCLFYSSFEKLEPHFFKTKKSRRRKKLESFLYFSSCTGERLFGTKLFGLIILFYQFITKKIIYNFSTICTVNVTNPPSLTALKSELWREPLLRQCFSIGI